MADKTQSEMQARLSMLDGMLARKEMTLSTSAERDAIINHGLKGWNEYLKKRQERKRRR